MGRFYKTADPRMLDFVYDQPNEYLLSAISATDQKIGENEAAIYDLYDELKADALPGDIERKNEIITGYEKMTDDLARQLQENPLDFMNTKNEIRKLSRDVHKDWTRGEIASLQGNYNSRMDFISRYKKAIQDGKANAKDFETALAYFDSKFDSTDYDPETGQGNVYNTEELAKYVNVEDIAETRGEGYVSDFLKKHGAFKKGNYIYTSKDFEETIPYDDIYNGVFSAMANDQELMDYLKQQGRFGRFGENPGQYIQETLSAAAARVAEKYDMDRREKGTTGMKADPFALEDQKQRNRKDLHAFKENYKQLSLMPVDRNNEQVVYDPVHGGATSKKELSHKLNEIKKQQNSATDAVQNQMYEKLQAMKDSISSEDYKRMFAEINKADAAARQGDFSELRRLAGEFGMGYTDSNGNYVATGIDELQDNYLQLQGEYTNQKNLLNSLEANAERNIDSEIEKNLSEYQKQLDNLAGQLIQQGRNKEEVESQINALYEQRKNELELTKPARINAAVDSTLSDPEFHKSYQSVYSTAGNFYDKIPPEDKAALQTYLDNVGKNLYEAIAANGRGTITEMVDGKLVTRPTNYNELVQQGYLSFEQIEELATDPEKPIKIIRGGEEITYKQGDVRVVPQNIPGVGRNSYQVTLVTQNPGKNAPQSVTFYVPKNDLPPPEAIENIYRSNEVDVLADEMEMNGKITYQSGVQSGKISAKDANYVSPYAPNVTYNPYDGRNGVTGKWTFEWEDGSSTEAYGNAGKDVYKRLLKQAGKGDAYDGTEMNQLRSERATSKSEVKYSSRTE